MEISAHLFQEFNAQYNRELQTANAYAQLANIAWAQAWDGFAKFLSKSADEELEHAHKLRDFLIARNTVPAIADHPAPDITAVVPYAWIATALQLERQNTALIQELDKQCLIEGDQDARNLLIWFLEEQRQSERDLADWLLRLERADSQAALLMLDHMIGE